ncbi:MAG: hypothetical protein AB7N76_26470 [Planctomycetota bacterium]
MAKRTKKKTTTKTSTSGRTKASDLGSLVSTQRAAIEGVANKHDLSTLFLKLAGKHGTPEQQALKVADLEREPRSTIEALVVTLAQKAHEGHKVHLSELGGWPACWTDERREKCGPEELLSTPISVSEEAVTCPKCKKAADIPSPEETAAMERAEVEAAKETRAAKPKADGAASTTTRAKRQLSLKENLSVRLRIKDLEVKGVVRPDLSMSVKGQAFPNPHEAANALAGKLVSYRIDGFQAWRYQDEQGRWRMLRDHA